MSTDENLTTSMMTPSLTQMLTTPTNANPSKLANIREKDEQSDPDSLRFPTLSQVMPQIPLIPLAEEVIIKLTQI